MLIRTEDVDKLYELEQSCFDQPYSLNILNKLIINHECYFINENNDLVGYLIMQKCDTFYELIKIGIKEEFRNRSFAKKAIMEFNNKYNVDIFLEVSEKNILAIKLYASIGFVQINKRKKYYHDNSDAIIMLYKN